MKLSNRMLVVGLSSALAMGALSPLAVADPKSELKEASARLEALGGELSGLQDDLAEQTEELERTDYELGEKQAELEKTNKELKEARGVLGERMRSSYKSGGSSLIQMLLGCESLEDLVSRIYYMDKVAEADADAISQVKTLEEQLRGEERELESARSEQESAVEELQSQVDEYDAKVLEAQQYYDALDAKVQEQLAKEAENARIQAALEAAEREKAAQKAAEEAEKERQRQAEQQQQEQQQRQQTEEQAQPENSSSSGNSSSGGSGKSYGAGGGGLGTAQSCIGAPYVYGADGPDSFDCSGLVCYCYGYERGRTTYDMISSLQSTGSWKTSMDQLVPGDLVFPHEGHVGIYIGNGQMIHAPSPGRSVCQAEVYGFIGGGTF